MRLATSIDHYHDPVPPRPGLSPGTRVLEVDVVDARLARALAADGVVRYLGLVRPARLDAVRAEAPELADRFVPLEGVEQAHRNSTDVLVLRGRFGRLLWQPGRVEHVAQVLVPARQGGSAEQRLARWAGRGLNRFTLAGRVTLGEETFEVVDVTTESPARARRYLSPVWGVPGLVTRLEGAGLAYVVLRWFEDLPRLLPGEDLDVLVSDRDVVAMQELLAQEPGTIPVDLYSESGLSGSDYRAMAYYPPELAGRLLERAVRHESGARVPTPEDHLHSLAYHALYHKGYASGLADAQGRTSPDPEHDYARVIVDLAAAQGVALVPTLEAVDAHLARRGWRPSMDSLRRLALANPWVLDTLAAADSGTGDTGSSEPPEPAFFLVRERALDVISVDEVVSVLADHGFDALLVQPLGAEAVRRCASELRGGNWGRGPFPVSGGPPALAVFAVHYGPRPPTGDLLQRYPRLTNLDVLDAKVALRTLVETRVGAAARFNAVHSADDPPEAWEYVSQAVGAHEPRLRQLVERRRADYRTDVPVRRVLSLGRRAKVELVEGAGGPVVRKTFTPVAARHLEREVRARHELGPHIPEISALLERGPTWFTSPWYDDTLRGVWRRRALLPLPVVRAMLDVLREIHAWGYDVLDAKPQNFVNDRIHGLRLLDLEFLHHYVGTPPSFDEAWSFVGVPPDFPGDAPLLPAGYSQRWRQWTGLRHATLVSGSPIRQRVERAAFVVSPTAQGSPSRRVLGSVRTRLRRARADLARGYDRWGRWRESTVLPTTEPEQGG